MSSAADALSSLTPGSGGQTSGATSAQNQLAGNFDTFLKLLTTQLQYQDPLSPMDSNQFTQQLVQFAQVEQSISANKNLESLVGYSLANATSSAVSYIGRNVTAGGQTANLASSGSADWHYTLPVNASATTISIVDAAGKTVYSGQGALARGEHAFSWDGRTPSGERAPAGQYKIEIIAKDAGGNDLNVSPLIQGTVTSVDIENGSPFLNVGGLKLKLTDVMSVGPAPAGANANANGQT